ncbi:MAG: glycosyltransferase family 4 protein [Halobacteriota archaeon]|nr:glycosyltransferase family 4 protein [Halobacteriota archaeon]
MAPGGRTGFSGVNENFFSSLEQKQDLIEVFDSNLKGSLKHLNALRARYYAPEISTSEFIRINSRYLTDRNNIYKNLSFSQKESITQFSNRNSWAFLKRTNRCEDKVSQIEGDIDLILQTHLLHAPNFNNTKPKFIYIDFTTILSEREHVPWARFRSKSERNSWINLERKTCNNATGIFTFSEYVKKSVIGDYGVPEDKVTTVYSGVNLKELPILEKDHNSKKILFVGLDFDRKGGQTLIKAFKEVKKEIKDAELIIVGSKPNVSIGGINVKGFIDRIELLQLHRHVSLFAMPSICDPFPNVFLEAMAYKTPCIGSTASGIPEMIEDGKSGLLVEPNDYKQLAEKIIYLLEDENQLKKMGERGRKRVEKYFTWDLVVDRMANEFRKLG